MKALRILKDIKIDEVGLGLELNPLCVTDDVEQAIKEIEALQKESQDLKNSNNELLKGLKSTQKRLEEWLEKCK